MCRKLVINTVLNPWLALLSLAQEIVYFTPFTVRSILHVINQLYLASIWVSFFSFPVQLNLHMLAPKYMLSPNLPQPGLEAKHGVQVFVPHLSMRIKAHHVSEISE